MSFKVQFKSGDPQTRAMGSSSTSSLLFLAFALLIAIQVSKKASGLIRSFTSGSGFQAAVAFPQSAEAADEDVLEYNNPVAAANIRLREAFEDYMAVMNSAAASHSQQKRGYKQYGFGGLRVTRSGGGERMRRFGSVRRKFVFKIPPGNF